MTTEPTAKEPHTSIASLVFLVLLIGGCLAVAFIDVTGPLAWGIGMIAGFLLGVIACVEFQIDKEKRREPTNS